MFQRFCCQDIHLMSRSLEGKIAVVTGGSTGIGFGAAQKLAAEGAPLGPITESHFDRHFDINVKGIVFAVQKALPLLVDGAVAITPE
jgi:NAD(P)-dependent dehydrogenase (short-subunit alcohol dehydrogenase family)